MFVFNFKDSRNEVEIWPRNKTKKISHSKSLHKHTGLIDEEIATFGNPRTCKHQKETES